MVEEFWKMGCRKVTVFLPPNRQGNKGMPRIPEKERKLQKKMEDLDIIKVSCKSILFYQFILIRLFKFLFSTMPIFNPSIVFGVICP